MIHSENLTDLLNSDAAAYEFFFALPPQTQDLLQRRDIRCLDDLKQAAADVGLDRRPRAF